MRHDLIECTSLLAPKLNLNNTKTFTQHDITKQKCTMASRGGNFKPFICKRINSG